MTRIHYALMGFVAFLALIVVAADLGTADRYLRWVKAVPLGDKVGHMVLAGILTLLAELALSRRGRGPGRPPSRTFGRGTAVVALVVLLEEVSQLWTPHRTFDPGDLTADALGLVCGALIARRLRADNDKVPAPAASPAPCSDPT